VKHVQEVSRGNTQITQLTFYLKLDQDNKMWLLFCQKLKVRGREKILALKQSNFSKEAKNYQFSNNFVGNRVPSPVYRKIRCDNSEYQEKEENLKYKINTGRLTCEPQNIGGLENCVNC
jgi:hypothetical protein